MKAMLCKQFGPPESLVLSEIDSESVGPNQLKIGVHACGVNFPDLLMIRGEYQFKPPLPFAPGAEVSGVVLEAGGEVREFKAGDRVIALTGWNGFADEAVVDSFKCLKIPDSMDYATAAGLSMTYGTSYHALVQRGQLKAGESLLVHGAAGGVGTAAVEIGKLLGATVIACGGDDAKLARVRNAYAVDHVINYRTESLKDRVKALTSSMGADVIYDAVGGDVFEQSLRCINWDGRLLVVGFASGTIPSAKANLLLLKGCSVVGVFWGAFVAREPETNRKNFDQLFAWHAAGQLHPLISHKFPLERAADALYALKNREVVGKCIITTGR